MIYIKYQKCTFHSMHAKCVLVLQILFPYFDDPNQTALSTKLSLLCETETLPLNHLNDFGLDWNLIIYNCYMTLWTLHYTNTVFIHWHYYHNLLVQWAPYLCVWCLNTLKNISVSCSAIILVFIEFFCINYTQVS